VSDLRLVPDRRRISRGGRRAVDRAGFAPMVIVIDDDEARREISEAILARLRFAVAPFASVDEALAAMPALRPEAVVARADAAAGLRGRLPDMLNGGTIPLLSITAELADPEALVEALRRLLRERRRPAV
jgi:FixJ family two-component response regulator